MVFWSSWAKKVRESINKLTFDKLKNRVDIIENDYATKTYTDAQDTQLSNRITANTNRVVRIETELGNANFVLYMGPWSATETYKKGLAVTEGDLWYVSNVNNNINHRPSGVSDQFWKLITSPSINLNDYYTKSQADARYAFKGDISNLQGQINDANTSITNLDNTMTNSFRQLDGQINTVRDTANRTQANLTNNYYTKTDINNTFYNKTYIDNFCTNWKVVRVNWRNSGHQVSSRGNPGYGWTKYGWLTLPTEIGGNLGRVRHVVFRVNSDTWTMTGWAINVWADRLDVAMTRLTVDNQDWDANSMEFDIYYL